jgi:hypothetical protein
MQKWIPASAGMTNLEALLLYPLFIRVNSPAAGDFECAARVQRCEIRGKK